MKNTAETTYTPEALEAARRDEERRLVREGTEIWKAHKEESLRQKQREQCELRRMLANYWPWGRPGGGAPCASALRKRNVPLEPSDEPPPPLQSSFGSLPQGWRTRSMVDRVGKYRSFNCVDRCTYDNSDVSEHGVQRGEAGRAEEVQVYRLTGGVELAPLLTSGRDEYGTRRQTQFARHVATDATRPGYMIDSWRALNAGNREYITDLAEQIREKHLRAEEERRRDGENCRQHFDTWRRLWGRPGHGAPIDHARRRNNLHDILYRTSAGQRPSLAAASVY